MTYQPNENPPGLDGFSFVAFCSTKPDELRQLFTLMGMTHVANHKTKEMELWQQNGITFFIVNAKGGFVEKFSQDHGAGACGIGFVVKDLDQAFNHCIKHGAVEKKTDAWHDQPGWHCADRCIPGHRWTHGEIGQRRCHRDAGAGEPRRA